MKHIIKRHHISFTNAFKGLFWALKTQPNYITHLVISVIVVIVGWYVHLSTVEWLIIIALFVMGIVVETINTAIEATTDAISHEWRTDIRIAKDVSAASVLVFAIGASIIAAIIFIPKLQMLFSS